MSDTKADEFMGYAGQPSEHKPYRKLAHIPTDNTSELSQLIDSIWAYGVDWTEHKDTSEADHDVSVYAAQIKSEMKQKLKEAIQAYISKRVEEARIDELRRLLMIGGVNIEVNDYCEQRLAQLTEGSKD